MSTLDFKAFIEEGIRIVEKEFGKAELLTLLGIPDHGVPTPDPKNISVFHLTLKTQKGHAEITSISWGEWGKPTESGFPILGVRDIHWPTKLSLEDAWEKVGKLPRQRVSKVGLAWPLVGPKEYDEPAYAFTVLGPFVILGHPAVRTVFVGAETGRVWGTTWS